MNGKPDPKLANGPGRSAAPVARTSQVCGVYFGLQRLGEAQRDTGGWLAVVAAWLLRRLAGMGGVYVDGDLLAVEADAHHRCPGEVEQGCGDLLGRAGQRVQHRQPDRGPRRRRKRIGDLPGALVAECRGCAQLIVDLDEVGFELHAVSMTSLCQHCNGIPAKRPGCACRNAVVGAAG